MQRPIDPNAAETSYRKHISSRPLRAEPAAKSPRRRRTPPGPYHRGRTRSGGDRWAAVPADTNEETRFVSAAARSPPRRHRVPLVRTVPPIPAAAGRVRESRYTQGSLRPTGLSNAECVQSPTAVPWAVARLRTRAIRSDGSGPPPDRSETRHPRVARTASASTRALPPAEDAGGGWRIRARLAPASRAQRCGASPEKFARICAVTSAGFADPHPRDPSDRREDGDHRAVGGGGQPAEPSYGPGNHLQFTQPLLGTSIEDVLLGRHDCAPHEVTLRDISVSGLEFRHPTEEFRFHSQAQVRSACARSQRVR